MPATASCICLSASGTEISSLSNRRLEMALMAVVNSVAFGHSALGSGRAASVGSAGSRGQMDGPGQMIYVVCPIS